MAVQLSLDEDTVVGKLVRVWSWFDRQSTDGTVPYATIAWIDKLAGQSGFSAAMQAVGWLVARDGRVEQPNFDRWVSESAKQRLLATKRKQKERSVSRSNRDKNATTEQDRTLSPVPGPDRTGNGLGGHPGQTGSGHSTPGSLAAVTAEILADTGQLWVWFLDQAKTGPQLLPRTDAGWQTCVAAAEQALTGSKPAAWFVKLVKDRKLAAITPEARERGLKRIVALNEQLARHSAVKVDSPTVPQRAGDIMPGGPA